MTTAADIRPATDAKSGTGLRRPMVARRRSEALMAYGFLAPQLIGLAVFMVGPLIFAFILAFSNWDGFGTRSFAGLSNFAWVFTDPQMLPSMRNTLWLTVLQVPGLPVSGFLATFFLQKAGRMKCVYRVAFFAPQVTSSIAVQRSGCRCSTRSSRRSPVCSSGWVSRLLTGCITRSRRSRCWCSSPCGRASATDRHVHGWPGERAERAVRGGRHRRCQ